MSEQAQKVVNKNIPEWAQGLYYSSGMSSEVMVYHDDEAIYFIRVLTPETSVGGPLDAAQIIVYYLGVHGKAGKPLKPDPPVPLVVVPANCYFTNVLGAGEDATQLPLLLVSELPYSLQGSNVLRKLIPHAVAWKVLDEGQLRHAVRRLETR